MPANILIVDDEPAIRHVLGMTLVGEGYHCLEAGDAHRARHAMGTIIPDLILLDWMLPGVSGLEFARGLKRDPRTSTIPIIMLSARASEEEKIEGLAAGVDDYITKPFSSRELLARVRAIMRRTQPVPGQEVIELGVIRLDKATHRVLVNGRPVPLSPTAFRLMQFFITHPERVYSRAQLMDGVWGQNTDIDERTVDVIVRRLRRQLEMAGCENYIQTVRSIGYRCSALVI
ncbi:MAG: phosphate regulon transcriptional regulator PhoB [Gammaproteobacteria bacterium]|nr:phosphate regulon transcriptional regulator PhoB [Gammaproteobacteria bacterium]